jgi:hypothetical protein
MKRNSALSVSLWVAAALGLGSAIPVAAGVISSGGLFADSVVAHSLGASQEVIRARYVIVNVDALKVPGVKPGDVIDLNLFTNASFKVVLEKVNPISPNGVAYVGRLEGIALSNMTMVVQDGIMMANIVYPGGAYQVRYAGNGVHGIYQIDQSTLPPEAEPIPVRIRPATARDQALAAGEIAADDGSQIDVLVVYDAAARTGAGGTTAMTALINLAITETNANYANSGVIQRVRLVHKAEITYSETGFNWKTTLNRLTNPSDGYLDNVHTLRDTYKADEVVMLVANDDYCGMAWQMMKVSTAFQTNAFALVNYRCATGSYSFGHEMGHNMGVNHDWYVDASKNAPYTYNKGYVNPGTTTATRWRTIMAYGDECKARGFSCTRIGYWSNPLKTYGGLPLGKPAGTNSTCTVGNLANPDCDADNHRVLNNTAYTVANFRVAAGPTGFNSNFNTTHPNWVTHKGTWLHVSGAYYSTAGVAKQYSSISYAANYSTLTYQARIKRTSTAATVGNANYISIRGTPLPLDTSGRWNKEYKFAYTNGGIFSVWKNKGASSVALKPWTTSATVVKNGWNTLKVVANGDLMKFYINNTLVWSGRDSEFSAGRVGIGMYTTTPSGNRLDVDWATLSNSSSFVPDPAADEVVAPGEELVSGDNDMGSFP